MKEYATIRIKAVLLTSLTIITLQTGCGNDGKVHSNGDVSAPTVINTLPSKNSTNVSRSGEISVQFSESMRIATVNDRNFYLVDQAGIPVPGTVTFDSSTNTARFTPSEPLSRLSYYTVTLKTDITDLAGNSLTDAVSWTFRVADGTWTDPELIQTDNTGGAINPQIAVTPDRDAIAVWAQSDSTRYNIWSNYYTTGVGWGTATPIETDGTGDIYDVRIAVDRNSNAIAVWEQSDGTRENIWSNYYTSGAGWGIATLIENEDSGYASAPRIAIDNNGNAIAVWYQYDGAHTNIWSNRYTSGIGWGSAELLDSDNAGNALFPQVAIDNEGNAFAVWYQYGGTAPDGWSIYSSHYTNGVGWDNAAIINTINGEDASAPQVVADSAGNAIAIWTQSDGTRNSIWSNRYTVQTGWGTAILIENDNGDALFPQIANDRDGNAIAIWIQHDGTRFNVWSNRYVVDVGWSTPILIESENAGSADGPQISADDDGNAIAIWYQHSGTQENIWSNRYAVGAGWGSATLIETHSSGNAITPQIAVDLSGSSIAIWGKYDGTYNNIYSCRFE